MTRRSSGGLVVVGSLALLSFGVGCTHVEATEVSVAEGPRATAPQTQTAHAAPIPAISQDSPDDLQGASRPRLSRTLRLGVETPAYESGAGNGNGRGHEPSGVTVVVNNNITQQQTAVGSFGGGYGYGRGGYGSGGYSYGQRTPASVTPVPQQAPQNVPPVGGDWARPTNYGPPAMR